MNSGRVIKCEQGDPLWLTERTGRVTASRVVDVVSKLKNGKYSAARETYMMELLVEALTGRAADHYVTAEMQFGIENEGLARSMYEIKTGTEVERVGLVIHPTIERSAASPDGLVGDDGLIEIKCPKTSTHLRYLMDEAVPEQYLPQMLWQMACTGRQFCDFVSYDPRLPEEFGLFIVRLTREEEVIEEMQCEVENFIRELNAMAVKLLKGKPMPTPQPQPAAMESSVPRAEIPASI
jgi:putative phage-type endonuclease